MVISSDAPHFSTLATACASISSGDFLKISSPSDSELSSVISINKTLALSRTESADGEDAKGIISDAGEIPPVRDGGSVVTGNSASAGERSLWTMRLEWLVTGDSALDGGVAAGERSVRLDWVVNGDTAFDGGVAAGERSVRLDSVVNGTTLSAPPLATGALAWGWEP